MRVFKFSDTYITTRETFDSISEIQQFTTSRLRPTKKTNVAHSLTSWSSQGQGSQKYTNTAHSLTSNKIFL